MTLLKIKYGPASQMSYSIVKLGDNSFSFGYRVRGKLALSSERHYLQRDAEAAVDKYDKKLFEAVNMQNLDAEKYGIS